MSLLSFLDRSHTIAKPGFSRWMVPPAALCVHLCIGQAYAFSVFNLPMTQADRHHAIGARRLEADRARLDLHDRHLLPRRLGGGVRPLGRGRRPAQGDVRRGAVLRRRLSRLAPRRLASHQLWLVYLGYGVLGGIGLGLGYISPVSTLIKWFPDRPGMATGMAIMGFGGGAFIASPLSVWLMDQFRHADACRRRRDLRRAGHRLLLLHDVRRARSCACRRRAGSRRATCRRCSARSSITSNDVYVDEALRTPQFWLIWVVLCLNVTAGIGVLGQASAMSQEMFPGRITPAAAAGFVGLLSLFNMGGRFFWASTVRLHRPQEHLLRASSCWARALLRSCRTPATIGSVALFVLCFCVIISMYGGGFATMPAYLRDMFGTRYVGAIHGLLLTAWSVAGISGPVLVNYIREYQIDARRAEGAGLQRHHVHHGRPAGGRLHLQPAGQGGRRALPHEGERRRSAWRKPAAA